jgi:hypothetical protein
MLLVNRLQAFVAAVGADIKRLTPPSSPSYTYTAGVLTGITYADGTTKTFTYTAGVLTQIDTLRAGLTTRKTFAYTAGVLTSIVQTTF